jgi:formylglycine-generating enzyme required for sulfatase activity
MIAGAGIVTRFFVLPGAVWLGCRERSAEDEALRAAAVSGSALATLAAPLQAAPAPALRVTPPPHDAGAPPVVRVNELEPAVPADACPPTMTYITGGEFWMGSPGRRGAREERPRFLTRVANFCLDTYEVTSASYEHCVGLGLCRAPRGDADTCNYGRREDHPINCVDWARADAYCRSQGARLPSELEWEYAARGGSENGPLSSGEAAAERRGCFDTDQTCPVGSFAPGAFGLHDMAGNVWEWTNDWFGDYPWPSLAGRAKVFRGSGWNRRSDRGLGTTLRNRASPSRSGGYLGFRCARLAKEAQCPFGPGDVPGLCRHGVLDVECTDKNQRFNGQRCADPGAPPCDRYEEPIAGHGCVRRADAPPLADAADEAGDDPPTRTRAPQHDGACQRDQPSHPSAYQIGGGSRADRASYGRALRCRNRDVGWNEICCEG